MIAYLILVHRYPEQFKRLFKAIHDPDNYYLVHVDENSGAALEANIREFLSHYPNSAILESRKAIWGGYSLVDAELRGMTQLLRMGADWEYFINLSGQDFPLKTQSYILDFLLRGRGKEFIKVLDQKMARPDTMPRVLNWVYESENRIVQSGATRTFMSGVTPYIGNQWMIVSRKFCQFVCHDPDAARYKSFYRNTFIADEGFFQTVMKNTSAHGEIVSDDLRTIDWIPDGGIKLRPRTFTAADSAMLLESINLFARKFDASVDSKILDTLEYHLRAPEIAIRQRLPVTGPVRLPIDVPIVTAATGVVG